MSSDTANSSGGQPPGGRAWTSRSAWAVGIAVAVGLALIGVGVGTRLSGAASQSAALQVSNSVPTPVSNSVNPGTSGGPPPTVQLGSNIACYSAIDGVLDVKDGVPHLDLVRTTKSKEATQLTAPPDPGNSSDHFRYCTEAKFANSFAQDTTVDFWYQMSRPANTTKLFVRGHAQQAATFVGGRSESCQILKESADGGVTNVSPYDCVASWRGDRGGLAEPTFTVSKKTATTVDLTTAESQQRAADLIKAHCNIGGGPDCTYTATKQSITAAPREEWYLVGSTLPNCTAQLAPNSVTDSQVLSWQDQIGGKVSADFKFSDFFQLGVEANYRHSISASHTFSQTSGMQVTPGREGGFWKQLGQFLITGNFEVVDNGTLYQINNFTAFFPLDKDYVPDKNHPELSIKPGRLWALEFPVTCPPTGAPPPALQGVAPQGGGSDVPPPASAVPVPANQQPRPNPVDEK